MGERHRRRDKAECTHVCGGWPPFGYARALGGWERRGTAMSLVVSLRVPDGIVVAADSLSTAGSLIEIEFGDATFECPHCKEQVPPSVTSLPAMRIPFSASSYTQKLFPLHKRFAVSCYGDGIVNGRSMYYHLNQFEREHGKSNDPRDLPGTVQDLVTYFEEQLLEQYPKYREDAPSGWSPVRLHVNGYQEAGGRELATTHTVRFGRETAVDKFDTVGCTVGGDTLLIQKLWEIGEKDPRRQFKYPLFSLQDAVDLSEFLVGTASTFQRFANEVPTVGGAVDLALVTPFHGFRWIRRKPLMERLEEESARQWTGDGEDRR